MQAMSFFPRHELHEQLVKKSKTLQFGDSEAKGMDRAEQCPFCAPGARRIVDSDDFAVAIRDAFPVSLGHTLVIPRRHISSFFDATVRERNSLMELLANARQRLLDELHPDAWNIGINDGPAAGQTVPHLHIHLIPRFAGDIPDPRGGVRWVLPDTANYWDRE